MLHMQNVRGERPGWQIFCQERKYKDMLKDLHERDEI